MIAASQICQAVGLTWIHPGVGGAVSHEREHRRNDGNTECESLVASADHKNLADRHHLFASHERETLLSDRT